MCVCVCDLSEPEINVTNITVSYKIQPLRFLFQQSIPRQIGDAGRRDPGRSQRNSKNIPGTTRLLLPIQYPLYNMILGYNKRAMAL